MRDHRDTVGKSVDRRANDEKSGVGAISASLEFFLLGHSEMQDLSNESCIMLSAMAFEQLLQPAQPTAQGVAEEFAKLWAPYTTRVIADAKRVKRDHHQGYAASQAGWLLHRKWMKELYEARSSMVHRGPRAEFYKTGESGSTLLLQVLSTRSP